jgi:hypothetical protein
MDYMSRNVDRTVKIKKVDLIEKIKENKLKHIESYEKAVIAYKKTALKQLGELTKEVNGGSLDIKLNLTKPIDNRDLYDTIIETFEWEVREEVELSQQEFREYVQDKTESSRQAMFSNTMYLGN